MQLKFVSTAEVLVRVCACSCVCHVPCDKSWQRVTRFFPIFYRMTDGGDEDDFQFKAKHLVHVAAQGKVFANSQLG